MTQVAFHFGAPDKLAYTCRLIRKAAGSGSRIVVLADDATRQRIDMDLWSVSPVDFVTHCTSAATASMVSRSCMVLAGSVDEVPSLRQVLVNLAAEMPTGFEGFERVIEVVGTDDEDRNLARKRWKQYAALGYNILRHDLNVSAPP